MKVVLVPFFIGEPIDGLDVPGIHKVLAPDLPDSNPLHRMAVLYRSLADETAHTDRVVVYAGDCLAPIGVLAGLQRRSVDCTLVWFDAHGDFHTWETTRSQFLGGMPLAMIVGCGDQTVVEAAGLDPLPESNVILVDARDLDPGEDEAVRTSDLRLTSVTDLAHSLPPGGPLYVHVDVDVVDPSEMPAVNFPAPAGPSLAEVRSSLLHLASTGRVVAFSISTWNPALADASRAAAATRKLASLFLA